ncbi:acyltransferase [Natrialbaceae archaeon GCM10025810]|uniref:acyltransferase n=1 Tax=Halovalidus salilacus TaxID=3075124 RepID=UPI0036108930
MGDRIHSIDSARAVAMLFVVAIHAEPFGGLGAYGNAANFVIDTTARFAVPFFFLTSGYLFATKLERFDGRAYVERYLERVGSIYVAGVVLYAPIVVLLSAGTAITSGERVQGAVLARVVESVSPIGLLYYGDSVIVFLWFLPALAISIALLYAFVALEKTRYVLPIALALHVAGVFGQNPSLGVHVPLETRDPLFFGFFYTALGFYVRSWEWEPRRDRSGLYLILTVVFGAAHVAERYVLGYVLTGDSFSHAVYGPDYSFATVPFATALFLFVLSRPSLGKSSRLPTLGTYAVVIYVVHPLVLYALVGLGEGLDQAGYAVASTVAWHLALTPVAYAGSLGLYLVVTRTGILERAGSVTLGSRVRRTDAGWRN